MRANLAVCDSLARRSVLEFANYGGEDLGFLSVAPGPDQVKVHNDAVTTINVALLEQVLANYFEMKRIRPLLEDPDIEAYLNGLGDRCQFVSGMHKIRNAVFHVKGHRSWRHRDIMYLALPHFRWVQRFIQRETI